MSEEIQQEIAELWKAAEAQENSNVDDGDAPTQDGDQGVEKQGDGAQRDEQGRFKAKEEKTEQKAEGENGSDGDQKTDPAAQKKEDLPADQTVVEGKQEQTLTQDKAPSGWTPAARERWSQIPEDLRKEILRREEASIQGVRQLQERYQGYENVVRPLSEFVAEAQQNNIDAGEYIGRVMAAERNLRNPDPNVKFGALVQIAEQYGIPLRQIINNYAGQEVVAPPPPQQHIPAEISRELSELRRRQEEIDRRTLEDFAGKNEFFNDVRNTMADLLEAGSAKTMEEAYDQACWATPAVREILLQRKSGADKTNEQRQRQAAAAAAAGSSGSDGMDGAVDTRSDDELDTRELIAREMARAANKGRV